MELNLSDQYGVVLSIETINSVPLGSATKIKALEMSVNVLVKLHFLQKFHIKSLTVTQQH